MRTATWAILALVICTASLCGAEDDSAKVDSTGNPIASNPEIDSHEFNESEFTELMDRTWIEYTEDFVYASGILDRYVKGNISAERAMTATSSVYLLNSRTLSELQGMEPSEKYANYYDLTLQTLTTFQDYLWSLGKYFETTDTKYATLSSNYYNMTSNLAQRGLEEAMFI